MLETLFYQEFSRIFKNCLYFFYFAKLLGKPLFSQFDLLIFCTKYAQQLNEMR